MNNLLRAVLMPIVRIFQVLLVLVWLAVIVIGGYYLLTHIVLIERGLFNWSWKTFLILNVGLGYIIAVVYYYFTEPKWWPNE